MDATHLRIIIGDDEPAAAEATRCAFKAAEIETDTQGAIGLLLDNLPDSVYVKDLAGRKTLANPADIRKMGVASAAEALGKTDFEVFPPDLAAIFDADDQHVIQTGQPVLNREERFILPDGSQGWQLTAKVPLRDRAGQVIGLIGIGHDITERKQAEAERERLLAQVQAQAEQIAQIMDTVPEGVLLLDADGQVLLANPAGVRDLTVLAGAAVGERLTRLGDLPLAELFAAAERGGPWHQIQTGRRIFEAIAQPIVTGEPGAGNPVAGQWVLVINDVTQARDLRDQLHQQERLAAVGQLAAGIAHDSPIPLSPYPPIGRRT